MNSTASEMVVALRFLIKKKTEIFMISFLGVLQTGSYIAVYTIFYTLLLNETDTDFNWIMAFQAYFTEKHFEFFLLIFCASLLLFSTQVRYLIAKKVGLINYSVVLSVRENLIKKRFVTEKDKQMIIYEARRLGRVTSQIGLLAVMLIQLSVFLFFFIKVDYLVTLIFVIVGFSITCLLFSYFFRLSNAITMLRFDFLGLVKNIRFPDDAPRFSSIESVLSELAGKQYRFFLGKNFLDVLFRFAPIFFSTWALYQFNESMLYIFGLLIIFINRFGSLISLMIGIAEQISVFTLFEDTEG